MASEGKRCSVCDDTGIYEEGDEWAPCGECLLGKSLAERFKTARAEAREEGWLYARKAVESAYRVEEFLRKVTVWEGSDEDELSEAIEDAEKLCTALEATREGVS